MAFLFQTFLQQAQTHGHGSKSTALTSLQWLIGLLITGTVSAAYWVPSEPWLWRVLAGVTGLTIIAFMCAYFYLLVKQPDALRSERYSLSKIMIERGLVGDSVSGLHDPSDQLVDNRRKGALTIEGSE